jgi:hypothetical protein
VEVGGSTPERALKNFRYVVASVNQEALRAWAELWKELQPQGPAGGAAAAEAGEGLVPLCGWAQFIEKFWLLKHYLDSIHRLCQ